MVLLKLLGRFEHSALLSRKVCLNECAIRNFFGLQSDRINVDTKGTSKPHINNGIQMVYKLRKYSNNTVALNDFVIFFLNPIYPV